MQREAPKVSSTKIPRWTIAFVLLATACAGDGYDVRLRFATGIPASSVLHVDLYLLDHCPSAADVSAGAAPSGTIVQQIALESSSATQPSLGTVPKGTYGLYARGFDASCAPIAAGCTEVTVSGRGSGTLELELAQATGSPLCASASCSAGRCVTDVDGGVDAGTDAGVDGGTDAGMDASAPKTCTLTASADGFTSSYGPTPSSGIASTLAVFDGDGVQHMRAYVAFDPSGNCSEGGNLPSSLTVMSATLTLDVQQNCSACSHSASIHRVSGNWTETSVGAGTDPSVVAGSLADFTLPTSGNVAISGLASDVQAWHDAPASHFGYQIVQTPSTGASAGTPFLLGAREHPTPSARPKLTLVYTSP